MRPLFGGLLLLMMLSAFSAMKGTKPNAYLYYRIAGFMLDF
jgi:hypothetical protein